MTQTFFGNPGSRLFGVHHRPRKAARNARAAVICAPVGHEFIRTHWCLRTLASQLARTGIHAFRFDYRGIGDSDGIPEQVGALDQWVTDTQHAIDEVRQQAKTDNVMLVGLRLGALVAARVARHNHRVNSMILWEPVVDGAKYLSELRKMHRQMVDLWVCKMRTPNDSQREEILGTRFNRSLLDEIETATIDSGQLEQPHFIVDQHNEYSYYHREPSLQRVCRVNDEYTWADLRAIETAWLRGRTSRKICNTAVDMFRRLERYDVLGSESKVNQMVDG